MKYFERTPNFTFEEWVELKPEQDSPHFVQFVK